MVVFKETANISVVPNVSQRPRKTPPPAFPFPFPTMSKTGSKKASVTWWRLNRPARQPYLVIEESGAYTAYFFRVKQFFLKRISFLRMLPKPGGLFSGAALITAQFLASSNSFEKVFLVAALGFGVAAAPLGVALLERRRAHVNTLFESF